MPVHRLGWDAKARTWFEWGVTLNAGRFEWERMQAPSPESRVQSPKSGPAEYAATLQRSNTPLLQHSITPTLRRLSPALPDGFILDVCPAAEQWWENIARSLV